ETRFRELSDLLPQIVFEMDRDGNFTFLNRIGTTTTGYTAQDLQKKLNALQLLAPQDRERGRMNVGRILGGESLGANEYLMRRKDGTTFPAIVHSAPIVHENEIAGLRGIAIDITDRKRAEEEVRVARERLEYVITSNPAVIFTGKPRVDLSDYNVTYMSNSVVSILGFKPQEFIGHPEFWDGHVHPDDLRRYPIEVQPLWKEGQFTFEYRFLHKDGAYRWIREEAKAIRDETGRPAEVIGYWTDVTERKRMEEQLVKSERLAAIGETVMMVGHDLRNPLQVMMNSLALLDEIYSSMPSDCKDFVDKRGTDRLRERIERQLEYMNKIISDLQDYA
ncbi:PAS domain S-box protein, partial [bacterium]